MNALLLFLQLIGMMTTAILVMIALTIVLRWLADFTAELHIHLRTAHRKLRRIPTKIGVSIRRIFRPKKPKSMRPKYTPPPPPQSHKQAQQNTQHVNEHLRQVKQYDHLTDNIARWERELSAELYLELARAQDDWARY
jgi:hypothetical protein